MTAIEQLKEFIKDITEENARQLLKLINNNLELVVTEYDKKEIERGMKEIDNGEYEFI